MHRGVWSKERLSLSLMLRGTTNKLTCFDVTFMEMFFTSKDFVVFDLPLEVFICYSVFGELIEPIFAPFLAHSLRHMTQ